MSDILNRANRLIEAGKTAPSRRIEIRVPEEDSELLYQVIKSAHEAELLLPELIAEIKRLRGELFTYGSMDTIVKQLNETQDLTSDEQAAYVARLETAYLQAYAASVKLDLFDPSWQTPGEKALGSLEKIKRGEQP